MPSGSKASLSSRWMRASAGAGGVKTPADLSWPRKIVACPPAATAASRTRALLELLKQDGEIHIIDTPFYSEEPAKDAKQRSVDYYKNLGYPEMAAHYYQHRWAQLGEFDYKIKYDPESYIVKFRRRFLKRIVSPFPWIIIRH